MSAQELKKAIQENDKGQILEIMDPIIERCCQMVLAGVLKKNIVRFLNNNKIPVKSAENFVEVAVFRAERYMAHKVAK